MRDPEDELAALREAELLRCLRRIEAGDPPLLRHEDREFVNFSSNDYLGLSQHPALIAAARQALDTWGTGAAASRLISGSLAAHHELEARLAELKQSEAALSFATGYACAVGTLTSVLRKGDLVILDKLSHASLVDGARLSGATLRVYPHNNLSKLERLLASAPSGPDQRTVVVTESVFSMEGDLAPLATIVELKDRFGALLLVDEAHALGVLGATGQGLVEELGLQGQVEFQMGTLGKAAGSAGGYLAATRPWIDLLLNKARSFIYSTAPPPSQAAASLAGINLIASGEGRTLRARLSTNLQHLATALGLPVPPSAIVPLHIGDNESALAASRALSEAGFLVPAIRFPTVPRGTARLRITLSATHTAPQIDALAAAIRDLNLPPTN